MSDRFDASLPAPHPGRWTRARDGDNSGDALRFASYQPPGGEAIPFVLDRFSFSGGQSKETAEYPFGGLWSNQRLNERPQELRVDGYLRGEQYIVRRNALVEALRIPTDDDSPGILDLPFWGRFPVVVAAGYDVSESSGEQGQCRVSIPFTRAGVSVQTRSLELDAGESSAAAAVELRAAAESAREAATLEFEARLDGGRLDLSMLRAGFGRITGALLAITGRLQGPTRILNMVTGGVMGILGLVNQGVRIPRELSMAMFNAATSIVGGIAEIKNSAALYGREIHSLSPAQSDNERSALLLFLSADGFALPDEAATASQASTKSATENLYKTMAYVASAEIIADMDDPTRESAAGYWRLLERLAQSIDMENPSVHAALADTRAALSKLLSTRSLSSEATRSLAEAAPLLSLAHYLGCDEAALRRLNSIADSFIVEGEVVYV